MDLDKVVRCARCVLPVTVPFLEIDEEGVCRHCRAPSHTREASSPGKLQTLTSGLKRNDRGEDCIVALSGGRDSSYVLHYVVKELGLKPAVMTYDWGMLTPTGADNQKKMIKTLGLREISVSDNISLKRRNIRRNILAWLHKPALGLVPLFMSGDKHFFYHAAKIKEEIDLKHIFFGITDIEKEDFKGGFCGIRSDSIAESDQHYGLTTKQKLKLIGYYGKEFLLNLRLVNLSIPETLFGFYAYYMLDHGYSTNLYEFVQWDEKKIIGTIQSEYDWQKETDTTTTWRVGDASAPLIGHIFVTLAGFTENDFLRSNQIRRGMLTRDEALDLLKKENAPRPEGLRLFCKLVDIDYEFLVKKIDSFPKVTSHSHRL